MTFAAEPWGRGKSKETWRKTWKAQQQWYFHIFKVELWEMLDMPDKQVAVESLENLRSQEMEVKLYYLVLTKMGEKVTFVHDFDQRSQRSQVSNFALWH